MVWIAVAIMTAGAVLCVVWPLVRPPGEIRPAASDVTFYRSELARLEADLAAGMLNPADAEGARAELGRRLITANARGSSPVPAVGHRRRLTAAALAIVFVPASTLGLYLRVGDPGRADEALASRAPAGDDLASAFARIEAHLASHPDDGRGFEVIAPVYLQLGRFPEAVHAYAEASRLLGATPSRRAAYGQALVMAADGVVTSAAREAFEAALKDDPALPQARFFLGIAAEQDGDQARARAIWTKLEADAPASAPWLAALRSRLAALDGDAGPRPSEAAAAGIAALPPDERSAAIRGMVDGLAARLAQNGRDADGWLRLVRAYTVLGDIRKARDALADARRSTTGDESARTRLDALARELGLDG